MATRKSTPKKPVKDEKTRIVEGLAKRVADEAVQTIIGGPATLADAAAVVSPALAPPTHWRQLHPGVVRNSTLTHDIDVGALGLVVLKLTDEEEAVLAEPVNPMHVRVRPDGNGVVYLSHPDYTRWFNRAFGRLGWAMVPAALPMKAGSSVTCAYVLHIHGAPVAYAMGEQDYIENNKEQTYGDALEATQASALRRVAKRMGVGLELWDRDWCNEWLAKYAIKVKLEPKDGGQVKYAWRRKDAAPFWNEAGRQQRPPMRMSREMADDLTPPATGGPANPPKQPPAPQHPHQGEKITQPQRQRLAVIAANAGRSPNELKLWLKRAYGWASSAEITRDKYDAICQAVEGKDDLP